MVGTITDTIFNTIIPFVIFIEKPFCKGKYLRNE